MIAVILLAAGQGTRFGAGSVAKQFLDLHGKPVFLHALDSYLDPDLVDQVILLLPADKVATVERDLAAQNMSVPVAIRAGGESRQLSIRAGLSALDEISPGGDFDYLVLHNAASPNTDRETLQACLQSARKGRVAQAYIPETRTQFLKKDVLAEKMLPRQQVATACDPTVFPTRTLRAVLQAQAERKIASDTTTDLAMELGYDVELVESRPGNLKITGPWDLAMLSAAMSEKQNEQQRGSS